MKNRNFIVLAFWLMSMPIIAQIKNEKRIYLFDTTKSMETLGIWGKVKDNLKNAIDQIQDSTTTIVVIPFVENVVGKWQEKATPEGKLKLKTEIDKAKTGGKSTNICAVIDEFYRNIDASCINYMFLMTDGKHNTTSFASLLNDIRYWNRNTANKEIYGFYVMLHEDAHNTPLEQIIDTQKNLWVVKSADINVNIFRLKNKLIYNIRNQDDMLVSIDGKLKYSGNTDLSLVIENNSYYDLQLFDNKVKNGKIRFSLKPKCPISDIPDEVDLIINVSFKNVPNNFTFVVPEIIYLKAINKKEKSITIKIK